jgi:hypothetical protein
MDLKDIGQGDSNWIYLAQDMDQWRDIVNMVMNLRDPQNVGVLSLLLHLASRVDGARGSVVGWGTTLQARR